MTATPKNNVVRLRLTELERESWGRAAGGKGKLSDWIRAQCNRAAMPGMTDLMVSPETIDAFLAENPPPPGGGWVEDARAHEEMKSESLTSDSGECPRWMHHRPNTYCGACKTVVK